MNLPFKKWKSYDRETLLSSVEISEREQHGHDYIKYLLHNQKLTKDDIKKIESAEILDRSHLLPYGKAIFEFGIEEAVLEISFSEFEESFIGILQQESEKQGYKTKMNEKIFLSHWIIANREKYQKKYGSSWDKL